MKAIAKRISKFSFIFWISIILCACQPMPDVQPVISKNDGSFDIAVAKPSENEIDPNAEQNISIEESFSSTDNSVEFLFHLNQSLPVVAMPVVKVAPHFLTEADVQRVAQVIYGENAHFWEAEPMMNAQFSKEEIQEQIARWSPYVTAEMIGTLYGSQSGDLQGDADTIKSYIENLTLSIYPKAPSGDFRVPCQWKFQNDSYYFYGEEYVEQSNLAEDNQQIQAWTKVGDYFYNFKASTRNRDDYKLNNIYAHPVYISPLSIDYELIKAEKLRTDYPTEEQIECAKEKAQTMLNQMRLGDWLVDSAYVETFLDGEYIEYLIHVRAVPVFNDAPAVRRAQINNLKSSTLYASNYYLSDANFSFSSRGELIDFSLFSPVDIIEVVNENVSTIPMASLLERARNHLSLSDYYSYGFGEIVDSIAEPVLCKVEVSALEYGLTRVKVPNTDQSYYYIPALFLKGSVEYIGKDTKSIYFSTESMSDELETILIINAVDGTIINILNE